MSLQRDELAARCLVAGLHDPSRSASAAERADFAVECADALLARLRPASGAPATDPRRTVGAVVRWRGQDHPDEEWLLVGNNKAVALKIRKPHLLDCGTNPDGGGDEFVRWATREECEKHRIPYVARPLLGAPLAAPSRPEWVPKVGERVRVLKDNANSAVVKRGDEFVVTRLEGDHYFRPRDVMAYGVKNDYGDEQYVRVENLEPCAAPGETAGTAAAMPGVSPAATPAAWVPSVGDKVRHFSDGHGEWGVVVNVLDTGAPVVAYSPNLTASTPAEEWRYIGPATSSERAAAGLPVEAPAFDEAKEREAALGVWRTTVGGLPDNFVEGWLARARVAAKGGA